MVYDDAGRLEERTDQRAWVTTFVYDHRGLQLTRQTVGDAGTVLDSFDYDPAGRMELAQRGTPSDPDAVSTTAMSYTTLGDLDYEDQTIFAFPTRRVDCDYDQAGNRTELVYPSGTTLRYGFTELNQVDSVAEDHGGGMLTPLVDYVYNGRLLDRREVLVSIRDSYVHDIDYDSHRRIHSASNRFESGSGSDTIVDYAFTYDESGNPLIQTADGLSLFAGDDRTYTVDRLSRLRIATYHELSRTESSVLDLQGNRQTHVTLFVGQPFFSGPTGPRRTYVLANPANEYATINSCPLVYDEAGNLTVDEVGRQYSYDELGRLMEVRAEDDTLLAAYEYDALGRRIMHEDPGAGTTSYYYYNGQAIIEEHDDSGRLCYHVNGSQYVDERAFTYSDVTAQSAFYLLNRDFSVVGTGDASGTAFERFDYTAWGDFRPQGSVPPFGTFTLHGRPIDVLESDFILINCRARHYDPKNGRWLQRDPAGYIGGADLYEAFLGNATAHADPLGLFELEITFLPSEPAMLGGRDSPSDPYLPLGYFDPENPEFVIFTTAEGLSRIPFELIAAEADRSILDPDDLVEWQEWGVGKGIPLRLTAQDIQGIKSGILVKTQLIAGLSGTQLSAEDVADTVRATGLASDVADELLYFYATFPLEAGLAAGSVANAAKMAQAAQRVRRVNFQTRALARSGNARRFVGSGADELARRAIKGRIINARRVAHEARVAKVADQFTRRYPGARILRERMLRDINGKKLIDHATGTGRRLDLVVVRNGKVIDIVEVTSPTARKGRQLGKTARIRKTGNTYIRDPDTRQLLLVPRSLEERVRRIP
jgi:RHS repeat-associated protein